MANLARRHDRPLDAHPGVDALPEATRVQRDAERVCVDERVERPTEGQVVPDLPQPVDMHRLVERGGERRHVLEGHLADPRAVADRSRGDPPGGASYRTTSPVRAPVSRSAV